MRAAVYLRQSLDAEDTRLAVARQREDCLTLCAERGWEPTEYVDNSVSATSAKPRPAYTRMVDDIAAGKIKAVVAWDLDRLHRRPVELETFIDLADRHGLALATVGGDADLSTDSGRLFARIKGAVARAEIERKSARQRRAGLQRAEMGISTFSRRPFGFADNGVDHHPVEAQLLRRAYAEFNTGATLTSIARAWTELGITTNRGNAWRQAPLNVLLRSPRNAGLRIYHGEIVGEAAWEPIVDETTWRTACARITDPSRRKGMNGGRIGTLLSGLALCGLCNDGTTVHAGARADGVHDYRCSKYPHLSRSRTRVDELIEAVVVERLSRTDAADIFQDERLPDLTALRQEAAGYRARLELLGIDFADGSLTAPQLRAATERLRANLSAVEAKMVHTDRVAVLDGLAGSQAAEWWATLALHRRRAVIDALMVVTLRRGKKGWQFDRESVGISFVR